MKITKRWLVFFGVIVAVTVPVTLIGGYYQARESESTVSGSGFLLSIRDRDVKLFRELACPALANSAEDEIVRAMADANESLGFFGEESINPLRGSTQAYKIELKTSDGQLHKLEIPKVEDDGLRRPCPHIDDLYALN